MGRSSGMSSGWRRAWSSRGSWLRRPRQPSCGPPGRPLVPARMAEYAAMSALGVYYSQVDAAGVLAYVDRRARPFLRSAVRSASHHDAFHELPKLTAVDAGGHRRIVDHPPVISHPPEITADLIAETLAGYRDSLQEDRRAAPGPLRSGGRRPRWLASAVSAWVRLSPSSLARAMTTRSFSGEAGRGVGARAIPATERAAHARRPRGCRPASSPGGQ